MVKICRSAQYRMRVPVTPLATLPTTRSSLRSSNGVKGASGGLHGVGASVVNALSARLDVEVDRGGRTHRMTFHRGEPGIFDDRAGIGPDNPFEPFVSGSELAVGGKVARAKTGTRVRYWAYPRCRARRAPSV